MKSVLDTDVLLNAVSSACNWLTDIAQVKTEQLVMEVDTKNHGYSSWKGAIRGEYNAANRKWGFFCPVWHTGQAVKALVSASEFLADTKYLLGAKAGAEFIYDKQIWEEGQPDHGLILAYEDFPDKVNTSAILEAMDGLMILADLEKSEEDWKRIEKAAEFLMKKCFIPEKSVFNDIYDPVTHLFLDPNPYRTKNDVGGRPLLDDGIFLKLYRKTGRKDFLEVHIKIAERLVRDQNPLGNWIDYTPCNAATGTIHPRHNYWWGLPLIDTFVETGRQEFLDTAISCGEFSLRAMRRDGGWIRGLGPDFNTDSFGHATSGSACAALLFLNLYEITGVEKWGEGAGKALNFCLKMQINKPLDSNLKGVILEKVLPPDGTDRSPYRIRDLGTIFFIIAAVKYLRMVKSMKT